MEGTSRTRRRRSADASTAELLRAVAGERIAIGDGEPRRRMSQREALAHLLWDMALRGDLTACRLILEYMEGKPLQRIAAAVSSGEPPEFTADELARAEERLLEWRIDVAREQQSAGALADGSSAAEEHQESGFEASPARSPVLPIAIQQYGIEA
jgi:hypothetical protein